MDQEMIERALVAASAAKAEGYDETSKALIDIARAIKLVGPPHPYETPDLTSTENNR